MDKYEAVIWQEGSWYMATIKGQEDLVLTKGESYAEALDMVKDCLETWLGQKNLQVVDSSASGKMLTT